MLTTTPRSQLNDWVTFQWRNEIPWVWRTHHSRSDVHHTRLGVIYIIGEYFVSYTSVSGTRFLKLMSCLYWVKSCCWKIAKTVLLSGGQAVDLRSKLRTLQRKSVKRAIECVFLRRSSSSGSRVMCRFIENCWKRRNLAFGDLWWPDLWRDLKIYRSSFVLTFAIAAYCVSLHGPGAELEGVFKHPTPHLARWAPSRDPARVKGIRSKHSDVARIFSQ